MVKITQMACITSYVVDNKAESGLERLEKQVFT
jgi:hypothetical protein